jgi:hypothetical protein
MSEEAHGNGASIGDAIALKIQELYRDNKLDVAQALLKIDNRDEAARAPFQFDAAGGRLHRRGCKAIPAGARSALYGLWQAPEIARSLACPRCNPMGTKPKPAPARARAGNGASKSNGARQHTEPRAQRGVGLDGDVADILYGALSIIVQFRSVLRERGREYRKGILGQQVGAELEGIYASLAGPEKGIVDMALTSLDQLTRKLRTLESSLDAGPRPNGHNGAAGREKDE